MMAFLREAFAHLGRLLVFGIIEDLVDALRGRLRRWMHEHSEPEQPAALPSASSIDMFVDADVVEYQTVSG